MSWPVQSDLAVIGRDQAGDDVKAGGLARAVGSQKADRLTALDRKADIAKDWTALVTLAKRHCDQAGIVCNESRARRLGGICASGAIDRGLCGFLRVRGAISRDARQPLDALPDHPFVSPAA